MKKKYEFPLSPFSLINSCFQHRGLIFELVKREISLRYKGSFIGVAWSVINPILLLTIYTFVFSSVFNARWPLDNSNTSKFSFALIIFVGLMVHSFCAECMNGAPRLILSNVNYVKKVVFPLEVLVPVLMITALFYLGVSVVVLLLAKLFLTESFPFTILGLPIVILPLFFWVAGFSWILCSLGTYVRDIGQIIGMFVTALLFLSPVFYPISAVPEKYQYYMHLNPLTSIIESVRSILIYDEFAFSWDISLSYLGSFVFCALGYAFFQKTRVGFADVL